MKIEGGGRLSEEVAGGERRRGDICGEGGGARNKFAHQGGHATTRFLEGWFVEGSLTVSAS